MNKTDYKPPRLAEKILSKLQYDDVWKTTLGDFEEHYRYLVESEGKKAANRWYWFQLIRFTPSKLLHKLYWTVSLFVNYLKIAFRGILKNKSYSFINIFGLAVGLACFVFITLFIRYEHSYDKHHEKSERIYRVIRHNPLENNLVSSWTPLTSIPLASTLNERFPEIEASTNITQSSAFFIKDGESFAQQGLSMNGNFFEVFTHRWIYGNPDGAMDDPESMIITRSISEKYFGKTNPIGKVMNIIIDRKPTSKTITGVIEDIAPNSHFSFDYIIADRSTVYYEYYSEEWPHANHYTYIVLKEGIDAPTLQDKLPQFTSMYLAKSWYYEQNIDRLPALHLQPLTDIHLKSSHMSFNIAEHSDTKYVYMFAIVGFIILIIACINYMNLATARSLIRAKEVGVRKAVGAIRSNLAIQFLCESIALSLFSIIGAIIIVYFFLPEFSSLINISFDSESLFSFEFLLIIITIGLCVGIFSGSYPAIYMSALKPIRILKNQLNSGKRNRRMRNALVISQFALTIILIISSLVVFRQLNYIQTTDTGLDREQVVATRIFDRTLWEKYETLKDELQKNSNILSVSSSNNIPTKITTRTNGAIWEGKKDEDVGNFYNAGVSLNFTEVLGLELTLGRSFSKGLNYKETTEYLLNESAVRKLGWTNQEALGKAFQLNAQKGSVVGILKDFNFSSLRQGIEPLVLFSNEGSNWQNYILIKLTGNEVSETLSYIETTIKQFSPDYPFDYSFLNDSFDNMYRIELRLGSIFNYLAILALFIASMGLLGLASFITEQRIKEIGIRKVLGAGILQVVVLLNRDFIKLVALSFIFATPLAWYITYNWLQDFAYRIELSPILFLIAGLMAMGIAIITVSYKSIKTALTNPVKTLRSE